MTDLDFDIPAGDAGFVADQQRVRAIDLADVRCKCGYRTYESVAEARRAEPDGLHKCPRCQTFADDHAYMDIGDEGRCGICDTRWGSHR